MDFVLIIKILGPLVVAIAIFMEFYKKKIKKGKFSGSHMWLLGAFLSVVFTGIAFFSFDLPGHWIAIIYYAIGVYALQFVVDMKILKAIVKSYAKKKGIELE